jgi:hypothetical protein
MRYSVAGIIGQKWPQYKGLSTTPINKKSNIKKMIIINTWIYFLGFTDIVLQAVFT